MDDIDMLYPEYQSVTLSSTKVKIIPKATSGRRISDTAKIDPETGAISQITNGNELIVRAAVKPTASIGREQQTFDFAAGKVAPLRIRGRHDACIALRAAVVIEAAVAIALTDLQLRDRCRHAAK